MKHTDISKLLEQVREEKPLVHNITNIVVANFVANGLLAMGASPVMANAVEEVADMVKIANSLVINIGTLTSTQVEAMLIAGTAANHLGVPVILDPVGAGATPYRTETVQRILKTVKVDILRGNSAEVANVIGQNWLIKGVDSQEDGGDVVNLAQTAARKLDCVVVVTGKDDVVTDGNETFLVSNGDAILTKVTGTGCLVSSVIAAFAGITDQRIHAAVAALSFYGVAAEIAAEKVGHSGPGSFQIELLNQLANVTKEEIGKHSRISKIES
ncbi:hydroxyethylthiazole kinase [Anaerobacillus alkaliphilus]|uniref:Hydroxyethylthiazole kinase n=1 Tax=Anaerobacillus alkaliphilus TaxID=1548597 RepID=A0A4Q0VQ95_9BACI|nr:hydroxyethylthiazole kinase [Anaerobacillus alkaliphilus]RXI96525.1 hydroxyethylthiazole kinase [Anaerobacillus alkaliphilus]